MIINLISLGAFVALLLIIISAVILGDRIRFSGDAYTLKRTVFFAAVICLNIYFTLAGVLFTLYRVMHLFS